MAMLYPLFIQKFLSQSGLMLNPAIPDDDPFLITSELEIRSVLRSIQRSASLVRMYARGNPDQSIMTPILHLDDEAQRLIVDCSPNDDLNASLVRAQAVIFDTQVDHVSVHFTGGSLENTTHEQLPAISLPYPKALRRLQRREYYRVDIPMGEPLTCEVPYIEPGKPLRRTEIRIRDLSVGGLSLLDNESQLPHQPGHTFRNVLLRLPETGEVTIDLVVLRVHTVVLPNKKEIVELGCRFDALSNADATLIQHYIGRLERRLNAKRRGY